MHFPLQKKLKYGNLTCHKDYDIQMNDENGFMQKAESSRLWFTFDQHLNKI